MLMLFASPHFPSVHSYFDELAREKFVDWFGYSASVSPYILKQFEEEVGYKFRPEFIIDQGYMNNTYRIPSKEFRDFQAFQRREVAKLAKEMVDIVHEYGKEAMMFMGDHWIGMEPFMDDFASIGLDAVVGSVGNGATLRLFSDIKMLNTPRADSCRISSRMFPRGRRPDLRGKGKLGNGKACNPQKPHSAHRLRRLS